jgi:hypothetical protein
MDLSLVAAIFSTLAFCLAVFSLIEVKAMQRSTHRVQFYNPANQEFQPMTDAEKKELTKDLFDNI